MLGVGQLHRHLLHKVGDAFLVPGSLTWHGLYEAWCMLGMPEVGRSCGGACGAWVGWVVLVRHACCVTHCECPGWTALVLPLVAGLGRTLHVCSVYVKAGAYYGCLEWANWEIPVMFEVEVGWLALTPGPTRPGLFSPGWCVHGCLDWLGATCLVPRWVGGMSGNFEGIPSPCSLPLHFLPMRTAPRIHGAKVSGSCESIPNLTYVSWRTAPCIQ